MNPVKRGDAAGTKMGLNCDVTGLSKTGLGGEVATGSKVGMLVHAGTLTDPDVEAVTTPWRKTKPWNVIPKKRKTVKRMMFESLFGGSKTNNDTVINKPNRVYPSPP